MSIQTRLVWFVYGLHTTVMKYCDICISGIVLHRLTRLPLQNWKQKNCAECWHMIKLHGKRISQIATSLNHNPFEWGLCVFQCCIVKMKNKHNTTQSEQSKTQYKIVERSNNDTPNTLIHYCSLSCHGLEY